jgi:hypothetical protein
MVGALADLKKWKFIRDKKFHFSASAIIKAVGMLFSKGRLEPTMDLQLDIPVAIPIVLHSVQGRLAMDDFDGSRGFIPSGINHDVELVRALRHPHNGGDANIFFPPGTPTWIKDIKVSIPVSFKTISLALRIKDELLDKKRLCLSLFNALLKVELRTEKSQPGLPLTLRIDRKLSLMQKHACQLADIDGDPKYWNPRCRMQQLVVVDSGGAAIVAGVGPVVMPKRIIVADSWVLTVRYSIAGGQDTPFSVVFASKGDGRSACPGCAQTLSFTHRDGWFYLLEGIGNTNVNTSGKKKKYPYNETGKMVRKPPARVRTATAGQHTMKITYLYDLAKLYVTIDGVPVAVYAPFL